MRLAVALGRRMLGRTWPNPAVGALVVQSSPDGPVIVGRGWTQPGGRPHAETEALRAAGPLARGGTLYVSLEPCSHHGKTPPCADALIAAGITRVVSGLDDPNPLVAGAGHARLRAAGIAVDIGVGADDARRALAGHLRRVQDGRPHVLLKLAVSADEKIGGAGRCQVAITGEEVRTRVHMLRATSDAIMVGIGTALADDPLLTCRLPGMADRSPVRVILDSALRLPIGCQMLQTLEVAPVWVICAERASIKRESALRAAGADVIRLPGQARLDLDAALSALAQRGITRLMVEGGATLAASLTQLDRVDEFVLSRGPITIGPIGVDALHGLPLTALTQSRRFVTLGTEIAGPDTIEHFERAD
jgi:diaminohydroxyphosphoribosylaminopyrimidine deaminase/5-amino-6-(5-phosphoribosylamino)uracil reductase